MNISLWKIQRRLKTHIYIALLEYRNTPIDRVGKSPTQLLFSRQLRSKLPTATTLLQPETVNKDEVMQKILARQLVQKSYHDKKASKPLSYKVVRT